MSAVRIMTIMGRKNGRPTASMPSIIGIIATLAAARGTVGTRRSLAGGSLSCSGREIALETD